MRILIDMSFIKPYELTNSIPLYGFRLLQGIQELYIKDVYLLINGDMEFFFQDKFPQFATISINIKPIWRKINWRFQDWIFDIVYRWKILFAKFDVILTLDELKYRTTFKTKMTKISVIHDLKDLTRQTGKKRLKSRYFYYKLINNADIIVAISEYTKQDILKHYNIEPNKIEVIHNSIKMTKISAIPQGLTENMKYILYVNTLLEYKNPLTLLQAYNTIKDIIEERLFIVGKETEYWYNILLPYIKSNGLEHHIIRIQDISNEELKYLYEHASAFVSCSQHEGFGYTPIEAAMCCCPVICTKCEALPETTMNLLNYYAPFDDSKELANKMIEVSNTPRKNTMLMTISNIFCQKYSSKAQINQFFALMSNLLREG